MDTARLGRDQRWFLAIFAVKVALGLVAFTIKPWLGWLFLAVYVLSTSAARSATTGEQASDEGLEPLKLQRRPRAPLDRRGRRRRR